MASTTSTPSSAELRRDKRHRAEVPITLIHGRRREELLTHDVSFRGVFVYTESTLPLRQPVIMRLRLPTDGAELEVRALVVHVVAGSDSHGRPAGVGVQIYGLDDRTRERWETFIASVAKEALARAPSTLPAPAGAPARLALEIDVSRHPDVLVEVAGGGVFVATGVTLPVGEPVRLYLVGGAGAVPFVVEGIVRRHARVASGVGMGVELVDMSPARVAELDAVFKPGSAG